MVLVDAERESAGAEQHCGRADGDLVVELLG
jgi:hypothetical protein